MSIVFDSISCTSLFKSVGAVDKCYIQRYVFSLANDNVEFIAQKLD